MAQAKQEREAVSAFTRADALALAEEAHAGQLDKAGRPYIEHPKAVAADSADDHSYMARVLHDVPEDCGAEFQIPQLRERGVPEEVLARVELLTHPKGMSNREYLSRLAGHDEALGDKLADLAHNLDSERLDHLPLDKQAYLRSKYTEYLMILAEVRPDRIDDFQALAQRAGLEIAPNNDSLVD